MSSSSARASSPPLLIRRVKREKPMIIGREIDAYRILEKIGQGGMGIVYKAVHTKLEQEVAIKVLSPEFSHDPSMRERFVKEAKIQARFSHASVVNILNYIEQEGNIYLVMEYVPGETLEHLLRRDGGVPPERAVAICLGVLDALDFMHSKGVIHRDIKPGNIMFTERGDVKVTDFGIAKMVGEKGQTKTGMRIGTLWYMSPEQIKGGNATVASDVYALGITLYQMVAGRLPFGGDSEYAVMKGHLEEKPAPPWELNSGVSRELGRVILKALHKDPASRYQTAKEFADDLRKVNFHGTAGASQGQAKWELPLKIPAVNIPIKNPLARLTAWVSALNIPKLGNRALIPIILAAIAIIILIIVLLLMNRNDTPSFPLTKGVPLTTGVASQTPAQEEAKPSKPDSPPTTAPPAPEAKPADGTAKAPEAEAPKKKLSKRAAEKKAEREVKAKEAREAKAERAAKARKEAKEKREKEAKEAREAKEKREEKARREAEDKREAKAKEEAKEKREAESKARDEARAKAKEEAKAKREAESKAKDEARAKAKEEAKAKREREAKEKEEAKAKEAEKKQQEEGQWKIRR